MTSMHSGQQAALLFAILAAFTATTIALAAPGDTSSSTPEPVVATSMYTPGQRVGVGLNIRFGEISDYDVNQLNIGFYSDWSVRATPDRPGGIEYVQLVRLGRDWPPDWALIQLAAQNNPGSIWLVGNEPEATFQEAQTPYTYAIRYAEVYTRVKSYDPTAKIAVGGVIQPTYLRRLWLDMVLDTYQQLYGSAMPVDWWSVHMQVLNEVRCAPPPLGDPDNCWGAEVPVGITMTAQYSVGLDFRGALYRNADYTLVPTLTREFRQWMKDRGYGDKPLMISEYGVLLPSDPGYLICPPMIPGCEDPETNITALRDAADARVIRFMTETMTFFFDAVDADLGLASDGGRLVQRWLWYALNDQPYNPSTGEGFNGSLFAYNYGGGYPGQLTKFGLAFKNYMTRRVLDLSQRTLLPMILRYR